MSRTQNEQEETMLKPWAKKWADNTAKGSVSHQMRLGRHLFFLECLEQIRQTKASLGLGGHITVLDIGGTADYWKAMEFSAPDVTITLLNLTEGIGPLPAQMKSLVGDAKNLGFLPDQSYDLVFSNSVIEHLFTASNQKAMAKEVMRVGKNYFIQTPNYWFPIEAHWVFPFFQFLPKALKIWLTQWRSWGHIPRQKDKTKAKLQVEEIRLLTNQELKKLFPTGKFYAEKWFGMTKSWIAHNF